VLINSLNQAIFVTRETDQVSVVQKLNERLQEMIPVSSLPSDM